MFLNACLNAEKSATRPHNSSLLKLYLKVASGNLFE